MGRKRHNKGLWQLLMKHEYGQEDVAKILDRSSTYVEMRTAGHQPWSLDDCYQICDWLNEPYDCIPEVFERSNKTKNWRVRV